MDETVLAHMKWRAECTAVWEAYGRWASAPASDSAAAHAAYRAALDREDAAADVYAKLIEDVDHLLGTGLDYPLDP